MFMHPAAMKTARLWAAAWQAQTQMMITANLVIAERMTQMALGTMSPQEAARMVLEKPAAFAKSAEMMARASAASKGHAATVLAGIKPIGARTRANARRLRRG